MAEIDPVEVPPVNEKTTVCPPVVTAFPPASKVVNVRVTLPPDNTDEEDTVRIEVAVEGGPGTTVIVGLAVVTVTPLIVASISVGVPELMPVNTAEYVPFELSVVVPKVPVDPPPVFENTTVAPPVFNAFPKASRVLSVTVVVSPD